MRAMGLLDALSLGAFAMSAHTLGWNLLTFRQPTGTLPDPAPRVSLLVPARNEARSIAACVYSLLAQQYPNFEVLVLDDGSTDGTSAILARLVEEAGGRLRVLQGELLPPGWSGKNWACHQLARAADPTSEYLLFTDADTTHAPAALPRVLGAAARDGLALLSLMPRQEVGSWGERLVVPLLALQILGYLPLPLAERWRWPTMAAANGQYLFFNRAAYEASGGHAAHPQQLAEDVILAQQVKVAGGRVRLANGAGLVRCRMYHSTTQVIAGFRRSFAAGLRWNAPLLAAMILFNLLAYWLPFMRPRSPVARAQAAAILLLRMALAKKTATPQSSALLHPLGITMLLIIQLLAARDGVTGSAIQWKGRAYHRP